tara:strand:- start:133 stop:465 length:333 start_codon:yes stop_codon:yes gene_type:complete
MESSNLFQKLKYRVLERLIKESYKSYGLVIPYGRNFRTVDNNPINYQEFPGIDVEEYSDNNGKYWVEIEVEKIPSLSVKPASFNTSEDAETFARKNVDRIKLILMNHQSN